MAYLHFRAGMEVDEEAWRELVVGLIGRIDWMDVDVHDSWIG